MSYPPLEGLQLPLRGGAWWLIDETRVELVRAASEAIGGKGGGRPDFAKRFSMPRHRPLRWDRIASRV